MVKEGGVGAALGDERMAILMFADDMVLLAEGEEELQRMMDRVKEYCDKWRLEVNVSKTKVMVVSKDGNSEVW